MQSIIRNVSDIVGDPRRWLESSLGQHLEDTQRVMIMVLNLGKEPDEKTRRQARETLQCIRAEAAANVRAQDLTPEDVDAIVDEAIADVRRRKQ
jgi:hypothetical protein